jgi:hypothetical protein
MLRIYCFFLILLIFFQQSLMAFSLYFLGVSGAEVAEAEFDSAVFYLQSFLGFSLVAYVFSAACEYFQTFMKHSILAYYYKLVLGYIGSNKEVNTEDNRAGIPVWLSSESHSTIFDSVSIFSALYSTLLNVVLSMLVFYMIVGIEFLGILAGGFFLSGTIVYCSRKIVESYADRSQKTRFNLSSYLSIATNISLAVPVDSNILKSSMRQVSERMVDYSKISIRYTFFEQFVSVFPVVISMSFVICYFYLSNFTLLELGAVIAMIPRVLNFFGSVHGLNILINRSLFLRQKLKSLCNYTKSLARVNSSYIGDIQIHEKDGVSIDKDELLHMIESKKIVNGRFLITGMNGSGKSTLLKTIACRCNAIYLGSAIKLCEEEGAMSSGEGMMHRLDMLSQQETDSLSKVMLLDEWDANLSKDAKAEYSARLDNLAENHLLIEVRH